MTEGANGKTDANSKSITTKNGLRRRKFLQTTGAGAIAVGLAGCIGGGSDDSIEIGTLFPTTGGTAALGQAEYNGIEMRVQEINDNGGIDGTQIDLENRDISSPEDAQNVIVEYSDAGKDLVLGTFASAVGRTAAQVCNRENLVYTEVAAVAQDITSNDLDNVFRTNPSTEVYAGNVISATEFVINETLDKPASEVTFAHAHEDSVYGTSVDEFLTQENENNLGMEKVATEPYPADTNDLTSVILNIQDEDPDIVFQTGYVNDTILFWETARQQEYTPPIPFGIGSGTLNDSLLDALGPSLRGIPASGVNGTNTNPDFAAVSDFKTKYQEQYGNLTNWGFGCCTYTGMEIVRNILAESGGDASIDAYREAAMGIDEPIGTYPAGYGAKFNDNGQNERALYVTSQWQEMENGEIETAHIYPEEGQPSGVEVSHLPRPSWSEMSSN